MAAEIIDGTLLPATSGCIDITMDGHHVHVCTASPGDCVYATQDSDYIALGPHVPAEKTWPPGVPVPGVRIEPGVKLHLVQTIKDGIEAPLATIWAWPRSDANPPTVLPPTQASRRPAGPDLFSAFTQTRGFYQWKGTAAWVAFHCLCGARVETEGGWFAYYVVCACCGRLYAPSPYVNLTPVPAIPLDQVPVLE